MRLYFCVGTYTEPILFGTGEVFQGKGEGLYLCSFDGSRVRTHGCLPLVNPSFLCIREETRTIYAVGETKTFDGRFGGSVSEIDYGEDGAMRCVRTLPSYGTDPCHIGVTPDGSLVCIANFGSGSLAVYPLDASGRMEDRHQLFEHEGGSVHPERQRGPHAHSVLFAGDDVLYVPDLGKDCVVGYRYAARRAEPAPELDVSVPAGSGPRYGEYAPNGRDFYLIHELSSTVGHFVSEGGRLRLRSVTSTLPAGFQGANICADLHVTPDGRTLYASNRGHDTIAMYRIDREGELALLGHYPIGGRTPRAFAIDPTGRYVMIGNQDTDQLVVCEIEPDGRLATVCRTPFPSPVCIQFFRSPIFNPNV
ncbi:MAG: lactonase family protein, partial [Clostridia bacterium]|nr:lactonase family protein [Clostridia bacterium]